MVDSLNYSQTEKWESFKSCLNAWLVYFIVHLNLKYYCQAPGLVKGPGQGKVHGPCQGFNFELKIQC